LPNDRTERWTQQWIRKAISEKLQPILEKLILDECREIVSGTGVGERIHPLTGEPEKAFARIDPTGAARDSKEGPRRSLGRTPAIETDYGLCPELWGQLGDGALCPVEYQGVWSW
jgi:hypothetical protein